MTCALIPAGGKSSRMGRPKLALPLGDQTILEHVLDELRQAAVEPILVVVGPHTPELVPLAQAGGAQVLALVHGTPDMRTTVEHGLRWLEEHCQPQSEDSWLLVPADHPLLNASLVQQLTEARAGHPQFSVIIPTFEGRRGHPPLIAWKHVAGIRALPHELGLNAYLRQCEAQTLELPVAGSDILFDLDTPEDYTRLLRIWTDRRQAPKT
jgi:molybdenum cofactor cytidylyltransferase